MSTEPEDSCQGTTGIPGSGLSDHGPECMLITQVHSKARCSWSWLMPISSGWVLITHSSILSYTIEHMRQVFAIHGLPELLVTDNGTAFTSEEFEAFLKANGIRHITTAPYHPPSNGLAERAVQTFKQAMRKATSGSLQYCLSNFLLCQHITPRSNTGRPPAELLMGRKLRSELDVLLPDVSQRVHCAQ